MITVLRAVAERLKSATGLPAPIGDAGSTPPPYVMPWGAPGVLPVEGSVAGPCGAFAAPMGVTCTGQDAEAAYDIAEAVLDALVPNRVSTVLPVADRHVVLEPTGARSVMVDRTYTLPSTNTHPAYVVLLFDVHSQPLPQEIP